MTVARSEPSSQVNWWRLPTAESELRFIAYGVRVGLKVVDHRPSPTPSQILARLQRRLPPGAQPLQSPHLDCHYEMVIGPRDGSADFSHFSTLYADGLPVASAAELDEATDQFEALVQLRVAEKSKQGLFVHAGVVGWGNQAILIPGRSYSGKTTLVAALVQAGATYYSDEYAVLDGQGYVQPYARPLAMRRSGGRKRRCSAEDLGGLAGSAPLPVGLVVITAYQAGASWNPRRLSLGQGVLGLLANTVAARRYPEAALTTLTRAVANAVVLEGVRGEAEETAAALLDSVVSTGAAATVDDATAKEM